MGVPQAPTLGNVGVRTQFSIQFVQFLGVRNEVTTAFKGELTRKKSWRLFARIRKTITNDEYLQKKVGQNFHYFVSYYGFKISIVLYCYSIVLFTKMIN